MRYRYINIVGSGVFIAAKQIGEGFLVLWLSGGFGFGVGEGEGLGWGAEALTCVGFYGFGHGKYLFFGLGHRRSILAISAYSRGWVWWHILRDVTLIGDDA
jgi:hypothetical protein